MSRWGPNAVGRLQQAAMELYLERGFDETTVAEIAARAGLTERTFFRHFTDKREVLFRGSEQLAASLVDGIIQAPPEVGAMDAVAASVTSAAELFPVEHVHARARHGLIAAHADLRERELIKMAALASGMAEALRFRGVAEPAASLAAESGVAVFKVAFQRWVTEAKARPFADHIREAFASLSVVVAARKPKRAR